MKPTTESPPDVQEMSTLKYDKEFSIAVAPSRMSAKWINKLTSVSEFVKKLATTTRTSETFEEFVKMSKEDQGAVKDVGAYVGAMLRGGRRSKDSVNSRTLLTFDVDYGKVGTIDRIKKVLGGVCFTISATHKYTETKPRFRLIVYPSRVMKRDEFMAVARKVAEEVDIEVFDEGSFQLNRLLFWSSTPSDGEFIFYHNDAPFLDVDSVLERYGAGDAWQDVGLWPRSSRENKTFDRMLKKQQDPLEKRGIVGAFCRTVSIRSALSDHLADVYKHSGGDRYTYIDGSSGNGLIVYQERFGYSNHASDPACGELCNAFDLIRIHKFSHLDKDVLEGVGGTKLPSYREMVEWARGVDGVKAELVKSGIDIGIDDFDAFDELDGDEWLEVLQADGSGVPKGTFFNAAMILKHDKKINKSVRLNEFSWGLENEDGSQWKDSDLHNMREYIGGNYKTDFSENKVINAVELLAEKNKYHPVQEYLEGLEGWDGVERVETFFIDYLGCEDNIYVREAAMCMFTAAVCRVFSPGYKFDYAVVISGKQGIGKSTLIKMLAKRPGWFGELSSFDPKVAMEETHGKWIVELPELTASSRKELEIEKAFLSATETRCRAAYGRYAMDYPRQSVFIGTTNRDEFLKDSTGNRRWWPIKANVEMVDFTKLKQQIDMIWAETYQRFWIQGKSTYLSPEANRIAIQEQNDKLESDAWEGVINEWLSTEAPEDRYLSMLDFGEGPFEERTRVCVIEIWKRCLEDRRDLKRNHSNRICAILDRNTEWERANNKTGNMKFGVFGTQKGWVKKEKYITGKIPF